MSRAELAKYSVSLHSWIVDVRNKSALIRAIQGAIDAYITEYANTTNPFPDSGETEISWASTIKNTYSAVVEKMSSNTSQFFKNVPKITDEEAQAFDPIHFLLTLDDRGGSWDVGMVRPALKVRIISAISNEHVASFCSKQLGFVEDDHGFLDVSKFEKQRDVVDVARASSEPFDAEAIQLIKSDIINPLKKPNHAFMIHESLLNNLMRDSRHARQRVDAATSTEDLPQPPAKPVAARR